MTLQDWTQILILISAIIWVAYDIYVYIKGGTIATESWVIWKWSYYAPGVAFIVGMLCGHWFFQMTPPENNCGKVVITVNK